MVGILKKLYLAGLGALSITRERAEEIVDELVKKGEVAAEEKKSLIENLLKVTEEKKAETREFIKKEVRKALETLDVPTRQEIDDLKKQLEKHRKVEHKKTG